MKFLGVWHCAGADIAATRKCSLIRSCDRFNANTDWAYLFTIGNQCPLNSWTVGAKLTISCLSDDRLLGLVVVVRTLILLDML